LLKFGLASDRVYHRLSFLKSSLLLKQAFHPVCLVQSKQRNIFCYTFRSLTAPSLSLVSSPAKSRLSSFPSLKGRNSDDISSRNNSIITSTIFCIKIRERVTTAHAKLLWSVDVVVLLLPQCLLWLCFPASSEYGSNVRKTQDALLCGPDFHVER
jgi:hypothetical protein